MSADEIHPNIYGMQRIADIITVKIQEVFSRKNNKEVLAHGMKCNMFWSNIGYEACDYQDAGIDCILTDEYEVVSEAVKMHFASK